MWEIDAKWIRFSRICEWWLDSDPLAVLALMTLVRNFCGGIGRPYRCYGSMTFVCFAYYVLPFETCGELSLRYIIHWYRPDLIKELNKAEPALLSPGIRRLESLKVE